MSEINIPQPQQSLTATDSGELLRRIFRFAEGVNEDDRTGNLSVEKVRQSLRGKDIDPDELLERYRVRLAPYIKLKIKPARTTET